jgi:hypothetical protein
MFLELNGSVNEKNYQVPQSESNLNPKVAKFLKREKKQSINKKERE